MCALYCSLNKFIVSKIAYIELITELGNIKTTKHVLALCFKETAVKRSQHHWKTTKRRYTSPNICCYKTIFYLKIALKIKTCLLIYTISWKVYLSLPCHNLYWIYLNVFGAITAFLYSCIYILLQPVTLKYELLHIFY